MNPVDTIFKWLIIAAYSGAAVLCLVTAIRVDRHPPEDSPRSGAPWWVGLGILLCLMGLNKYFNTLSALVADFRVVAQEQHLYDQRRTIQEFAITVTLSLSAFGAVLVLTRKLLKAQKTLVIAVLFTLGLVITRAVSLHQMDAFLQLRLWGMRINWLLEFGGILVIYLSIGWISITTRNNAATTPPDYPTGPAQSP